MKKLIATSIILLLATSALAGHSYHAWSKDGAYKNNLGQTVCTWVCRLGGREHYTTTKGYGVCPRPRG